VSNEVKGVAQQWKACNFTVLHPDLVCKDTSQPVPFRFLSKQTPSLSYQKNLTKNVKVKDHLEVADISDYGIFHVFDCCQCDPHVSQKTWIIIWFFSWPNVDDFTCFCTSQSSFFLLSFIYWDCISVGKNTQHLTCWAPISWVSAAGLVQIILTFYLQVHFPTLFKMVCFLYF